MPLHSLYDQQPMTLHVSRFTFHIFLFALVTIICACAPAPNVERGILEGHVNFSLGADTNQSVPTPIPLFYEQHSLIIYRSDGKTLVTNVLLDPQANFRLPLDPGVYVVKWRKYKVETAQDLPATVTVVGGKTTRLDVNIDTGSK